MRQRWALFAVGAWFAGNVLVATVAAENFFTIDRLLAESRNTAFLTEVERIGRPQSRDLLRYLSSELNRLYFQQWTIAQVAIGVSILWLIGFKAGSAKARWAVLAMLAIVAAGIVWLAPQIVAVGRGLDFVPRDPPPPALDRFWTLHAIYTGLELCKLVLGVLAAAWIGPWIGPRN
jgi:hypothetical protein